MASEPGLFVSWFEHCAGKKKQVKRQEVTEVNVETSGSSTYNLDNRVETHASSRHTETVGSSGQDICGCCYTSNTVTPTHKDTAPGDVDLPDGKDGKGGVREDADVSGKLWDDPDFPTPSSITLKESGETFTGIEWLRPPVITAQFRAKPQFIVTGAVHYDINQGKLGDCWYLTSVACIATSRDRTLLGRILPANQSFQRNYTGKFQFRFWDFGEWRTITIDDRIPTVKDRSGVNRLIFGRNSDQPYEFWVPLMEKAFVKLKGARYENVERGNANTALIHFTGGVSFSEEPSKMNSSSIFHNVHYALVKQHGLVSCITPALTTRGLVPTHVYCISSSRFSWTVKRINCFDCTIRGARENGLEHGAMGLGSSRASNTNTI